MAPATFIPEVRALGKQRYVDRAALSKRAGGGRSPESTFTVAPRIHISGAGTAASSTSVR